MELEELRDMRLVGMTIIEHRGDGENVVGTIGDGGVNANGSLALYWHHHDRCGRTTTFLPSCWQCEASAGVIFLKRIGKEPEELTLIAPWHDANLYTIFRQAR